MKKYFYFLFLLIFFGCSSSTKKEQKILRYIDLSAYFNHEANRLQASNVPITKWIKDNNGFRSSIKSNIDWKKEFAFFADNDINKAAWKNSYRIDSSLIDSCIQILYQAKEPQLKIRSILIKKRKSTNVVEEIQIRLRNTNALYSSFQLMDYQPEKGYFIVGHQKVRFLGESNYVVFVNYFDMRYEI